MVELITQSELEAMFTAERVAEIFSAQSADGSTTGVADADALTMAIRMGSAEVVRVILGVYPGSLPTNAAECPDTLKHIVGVCVMRAGALRRPEYQTNPAQAPYLEQWKQARADLKELREGYQRISTAVKPSNVGGQIATHTPEAARPFTFLGDPRTGRGGFNSGGF